MGNGLFKVTCCLSAAQPTVSHSKLKCYEVKATYHGAKKMKGVHASINREAENHDAHYSLDRNKTIWYNDDSDDLQIAVLFPEGLSYSPKAYSFQTFLGQWYLENPAVRPGAVSVERKMEVKYVAESDLLRVMLSDYDGGNYDTSIRSLD